MPENQTSEVPKTMRSITYNAHETRRMRSLHGATLAPFWRRAVAFILDFVIGSLIFMVPMILIFGRRGHGHITMGTPREDVNLQLNFYENWYSILWWMLYFGLTSYFGKGQTPGKRLVRIRIVSLVNERPGLWTCMERALGYAASALEFGFGFLQYFIHPNRRTVHDRIAETIVVDDRPSRRRRV
jgi:uncharacterized RDD family membrane protein YckC